MTLKIAFKTCCLAAIVWGVVWNLRTAAADFYARRNQPESTRLAMRCMPANGAYPAQLAEEEYSDDPPQAQALLQQAVQRNRYNSTAWIQSGLLYEAAGELPQAERALLQAAAVDATYLPAWSLANFYFRRQDAARFWIWARKAAQMAPGDATPLFRLAWYVNANAADIEDRLRMKRPRVEAQFVSFLTAQGDAAAVGQAALHLAAAPGPESRETLLAACDWLLAQKHPDTALALWNELARHHQVAYAPLIPGSAGAVTNSDFAQSPTSQGFDWRLQAVDGVASFLNADPGTLGFEFSGREPDSALLLTQTAPVQAQKNYLLTVDYQTSGIAPGAGLAWFVTDEKSGAIVAQTASLSAEGGAAAYACFRAPEGSGFVNLSLLYRRQPGTVRLEGKLALRAVHLSLPAQGDCTAKKNSNSGAESPEL